MIPVEGSLTSHLIIDRRSFWSLTIVFLSRLSWYQRRGVPGSMRNGLFHYNLGSILYLFSLYFAWTRHFNGISGRDYPRPSALGQSTESPTHFDGKSHYSSISTGERSTFHTFHFLCGRFSGLPVQQLPLYRPLGVDVLS